MKHLSILFFALFMALTVGLKPAQAATAQEIDTSTTVTLSQFKNEVRGADDLLRRAKGVLVFPVVIKAGIGLGGEYGEGALRIKGKTVDYYSIGAASIGFQLGVQKKSVILVFLEENALQQFRHSSGWKAGVDGSVAVVKLGAGGAIDTSTMNEPIVSFIIGQKGLMYNLTLEGAKFSKLNR
jgi:lipid-binding SYLF domain-containing protein